jgi:hypothetical protein
LNIAVFDVVVKDVRVSIIESAKRNLKKNGLFCLIIPRNDWSITRRCNGNTYKDGFIFKHHGTNTFFKNFENNKSVIKFVEQKGLSLIKNISNYRQAGFIFSKN